MRERSRRERWVAGAVVALVILPWGGVAAWLAVVESTSPLVSEPRDLVLAESPIADRGLGGYSDPWAPLATWLPLLPLFALWAAMWIERERPSAGAFAVRADGLAIGASIGMLVGFLLDALVDVPAGVVVACLVTATLAFGVRPTPAPQPRAGLAG